MANKKAHPAPNKITSHWSSPFHYGFLPVHFLWTNQSDSCDLARPVAHSRPRIHRTAPHVPNAVKSNDLNLTLGRSGFHHPGLSACPGQQRQQIKAKHPDEPTDRTDGTPETIGSQCSEKRVHLPVPPYSSLCPPAPRLFTLFVGAKN